MAEYNYDPAKAAAPKNWADLGHSSNCNSYCCQIVGPGGKTNNIENNEKGMLDSYILSVMGTITGDELPSEHDKHAQGIYKTHSFNSTAEMSD